MALQVELSQSEPQELTPQRLKIEARAVIGEKGRLVIPATIREALGLKPGDTVDMHIEDHELRISTRWGRLRRAQERARKFYIPGRLISEELSAERRAEALAE
jgi:AbrB family looped-hinge helix DNA binding protein